MDATEIPEGIDPKNACRVEVTVNSYFSIIHGKKVYNRGRDVGWVVDSEKYSIINLESDIAAHFTWDNNQQAYFWVVKGVHWTCKLISDDQLRSLLRASQLVKFMMIVGSRVEEDEMPPAVNMDVEGIPNEVPVVEKKMEFEGFEWAELPQYGENTTGPSMPEEEEKEHFMAVGCDPDGDDPTGVDEEWRYFKPVQAAVNHAQPKENMTKRARVILDLDSERVHDDVAPSTTYDKENPVISEGDTFGDKEEFIMTLRTYAIKNNFGTVVEHSDKERYRARCADANCAWKIYAKKLHGGDTFMVVKLSNLDDHSCPNSEAIKGHVASTAWISQRAKQIMEEDPTLTAKKLQRRIERFKMAYHFQIAPMNDKSEWPKVDPGFEMIPPPLQRAVGRPRKQRIKARGEPGKRGPYQCKRCFQFGHIEKGCNATQAELEQELPPPRPKKVKKPRINKSEAVGTSTTDPGTSTAAVQPSPTPHLSPGVITRRMASLSPTSPGVTTRRMAAISPGGINRRLIIE